jgi:SSS family solute:Na+ symporter
VFLSLSYFGTDQSQVQRYLSGGSLRESRLGLMFNALLKIPMQFFILLLGTLVFVFYQFNAPPVFFNQATWNAQAAGAAGQPLRALEGEFATAHAARQEKIRAWLAARSAGDAARETVAKSELLAADQRINGLRAETKKAIAAADPRAKTNDSDYIFITFVLQQMPHGLIGLLVALIVAAAISSLSSELMALGTTTAVDFYRHLVRPNGTDAGYVSASKWLTVLWGVLAIGFALLFNLTDNLIQAINKLGSIFYGVILGVFLVAFFAKRVRGTAVFWAACLTQAAIIVIDLSQNISFLWYNAIGCLGCVGLSLILQRAIGSSEPSRPAALS